MVRVISNKDDIIKCWQEAFGDTAEEIEFFIDNVKNSECIAFYIDDEIAGMLYLVEKSYIYAACTLKKYRKQGVMTKLLDYCKMNYPYICLIPANESLIDYYKNRGLTIVKSIDELKFNQIDEIQEYLLEGCELDHPLVLAYERDK